MKFALKIELGNAEMQTGWHVARTLEAVAAEVAISYDGPIRRADGVQVAILDLNGNTVGRWEVLEDA